MCVCGCAQCFLVLSVIQLTTVSKDSSRCSIRDNLRTSSLPMRQGGLRICPSPGGQEKKVISCILNSSTDLQKQCKLAVVLNLNHLCLSFRTHCFVLTLKRRSLSRILFFKRSHSLVFASSCFFIMLISSGESISSLLMLPGESISFKGSLCFLAAPARRLVAHSSSLFLCSSRNS